MTYPMQMLHCSRPRILCKSFDPTSQESLSSGLTNRHFAQATAAAGDSTPGVPYIIVVVVEAVSALHCVCLRFRSATPLTSHPKRASATVSRTATFVKATVAAGKSMPGVPCIEIVVEAVAALHLVWLRIQERICVISRIA